MTTIGAALAAFDLAVQADGLADSTVRAYRWLLSESPHALAHWVGTSKRIVDVTTPMMREYIVWLRKRPNVRTGAPLADESINDYIRLLHRFFSWSSAEYGVGNPMHRIAFPKTAPMKPRALDLDDLRKLFDACGDNPSGIRNRAILAVLIDTGMRAGGLCRLRLEDVDIERRRALVTEKGDKTRYVLFSSACAAILMRWIAVRESVVPFFYSFDTNEALTVGGLRTILRNIARRAKVTGRVNPHSFRHAFAREYLRAGGDLATLSRLMGHKQTRTTVEYYTLFTETEIAAAHERYSPLTLLQR